MGAGELSGGGGGKGGHYPYSLHASRCGRLARKEGGGVMVVVIPRVSRGLLGSSADLAFFPTSFCHKIYGT